MVTCVTGETGPPLAAIRVSGDAAFAVASIEPSASHAPPRMLSYGATVWTVPVSTSTRFKSLSTENPIARPSGAQNGNVASSVPGRTRAVVSLNRRSHSRDVPSDVAANANVCPSGEMAIEWGRVVGGVVTSSRSSAASASRSRVVHSDSAIALAIARPDSHTSRSR